MMGGELPRTDAWTLSLLTNRDVLELDQHSTGNHVVISNDKTVVWVAQSTSGNDRYVAIFNISDDEEELHYAWKELGLSGSQYKMRDLWEQKDSGSADSVSVTVPSHGTMLYRLSPN
jgi:hypothetical protein